MKIMMNCIKKYITNFEAKSFFKKTLFVSVFFVLFLIGFLLLFKINFSYTALENKLEEFTGLKIEFVNPKTTFDYKLNLNFKADSVNVFSKDKKKHFVKVVKPDMSFKPVSLLFKRLNFSCFDADLIEIVLLRDKKGKIDIIDEFKIKDFDFLKNKKIDTTYINSKVKRINIDFYDEYKIKSKISLNLLNNNVFVSKRDKTFKYSQEGFVKTSANSKEQTANLNISIKSKYPFDTQNYTHPEFAINFDNINLYIFNDLARKYISKDILALLGTVDINIFTDKNSIEKKQKLNIKVQNPTLKLTENKTISPYKKGIDITGYFDINRDVLKIEKAFVKADKLNVDLAGDIKKPFSKKPGINLNIKVLNTQINNFICFLPDNLIYYRPKGIPVLKKSNFFATVDADVKLSSIEPVDITGNLKASDIYIPGYPKSSRKNDVNVIFMKDKMRVYTRVYTPDYNEYVYIDGISNLDNSLWGKYSVKSTKKIDLAFAKLYLVPIQQIIGFNIGPVPIMDISGYGNIDIKTQGTLDDAQIFGEFEAQSASAKIDGLDAKLENGVCELIFDNRNLIFKQIKGKLQGADFLLTGVGNTKGEVVLDTKIKNAKTSNILKIFNNSLISKPYRNLTKDIVALSGDFEADIKLKGTIKDYENKEFFNSLNPFASIILKKNKVVFKNNISFNDVSAVLNFKDKQSGSVEFSLGNSKFNSSFFSDCPLTKIAKGEEFELKTKVFSNKIQFKDIVNMLSYASFTDKNFKSILREIKDVNFYLKTNIESAGKVSLNNINLNNFKNKGYIIGLNSNEIPNVRFNSGIIKIENNKINFDKFNASLMSGTVAAKGSINNFLDKTPDGDLKISIKNVNLQKISKVISKVKQIPFIVKNGEITFKGENIRLTSLNIDCNKMPLFLNAQIRNIYHKPVFESDFSTIVNENTMDNIINPYLTYPVKIKGEVPAKGVFKGGFENYTIDISASVPKDSDIYFSGANLGDINHKRELKGKIVVKDNSASIDNFRLIKYIENQNKKVNPKTALKVSGKINQKNDSLYFDNFKVVTNTPINVRILNLIFKKSILKKGNFECNISLNGLVNSPNANGRFLLNDLDIPLYNTQINDIKIDISDKFIEGKVIAKNKQSDLDVVFKAQNRLNPPYIIENVGISSNMLDVLEISKNININTPKADIEKKPEIILNPADILVKKGEFAFREVVWDKINAKDLKGTFSYKDNVFDLNNIALNIAKGKVEAKGKYLLKTSGLNLYAQMFGCDSNVLTEQFLNLSNQIFGQMNGSINLNVKNLNTPSAIKTLKSDIDFSINNGKMPKLGSLEYLLRAGNLIKSGILGLSLNNIIEVLTPYKTGEFEKISGNLKISAGEVEKLEIKTQGKNLSLLLEGSYSIFENFADINIYGKLSQNISNVLGAVGNASINQFINSITPKRNREQKQKENLERFSKIPPIENESQEPRFFTVKVLGDINKENYIKSFNWN